MFDVDLATGESWRESAYRPGDSVVTAETPIGRLGLAICYDVRFPPCSSNSAGGSAMSSPSRRRSPCPPARRTGT
jgi:predicted amidohydrolase